MKWEYFFQNRGEFYKFVRLITRSNIKLNSCIKKCNNQGIYICCEGEDVFKDAELCFSLDNQEADEKILNKYREESLQGIKTINAPNLLQLVEPVDDCFTPTRYIIRTTSKEMYSSIICDMMYLGCRHIHVSFTPGAGNSAGIYHIRAVKPSYFVIQKYLEDYSGQVTIFVEDLERKGLWTGIGKRYPLRDCIPPCIKDVIVLQGSNWESISEIKWYDIYAVVKPDISFKLDKMSSAVTLPEVAVKLSFTIAETTPDSEIWLVRETDHDYIERAIETINSSETDQLMMATVIDEDDRGWFVFREKSRGQGRKYIPISPQWIGFYRYPGHPNIYIPYGRKMLPVLRQDNYTSLFGLKPDELLLLFEEKEGEITGFKLKQQVFSDLTGFVRYMVDANIQRAEKLFGKFQEEFHCYTDLIPVSKSVKSDVKQTVEKKKSHVEEEKPEKKESEKKGKTVRETIKKLKEKTSLKEKVLPEKLKNIFSEILRKGQREELWHYLVIYYLERNRLRESFFYSIQRLWILPEDIQQDCMDEIFEIISNCCPEIKEAGRGVLCRAAFWRNNIKQVKDKFYNMKLFCFAYLSAFDESVRADRLWWDIGYQFLRTAEEHVGYKMSYILWMMFLKSNNDKVEREHIFNRFTERLARWHLSDLDIPAFLVESFSGMDQYLDDDVEFISRQQFINKVNRRISKMTRSSYKAVCQASLALLCSFLRMENKALRYINEAYKNCKNENTFKFVVVSFAQEIQKRTGMRVLQNMDIAGLLDKLKNRKVLSEVHEVLERILNTIINRCKESNPSALIFGGIEKEKIIFAHIKKKIIEYKKKIKDIDFKDTDNIENEVKCLVNEILNGKERFELSFMIEEFIEKVLKNYILEDLSKIRDILNKLMHTIEKNMPIKEQSEFYKFLVYSSCIEGFFKILDFKIGIEKLTMLINSLGQIKNSLDLAHVCSNILSIIEYLPQPHRVSLIMRIIDLLLEDFNIGYGYFTLEVLDQAFWTYASQSKYMVNVFHRYYHEEEELIRKRIRNDYWSRQKPFEKM